MPLLVKICGLKTAATLDAALEAGADLVGFVFFPPSPRHIEPEASRLLAARVGGRAGKVALTVDADDALIAAIIGTLAPDILQLHGGETPERVAAVRQRFGLPVMKAVPIATPGDVSAARIYAGSADRLLFDARPPREATRPGGLGTPFDWKLLQNVSLPVPFLLSGGLDCDNVARAIAVTGAPGVDVSSGVERVPGEKDVDKIRAFIRTARHAAEPADIARTA